MRAIKNYRISGNRSIRVFVIFFIMSCAKMAPPPGGPEDKTPPELLGASPAVRSTVDAHEIVLAFSEPIDPLSVAGSISLYPPIAFRQKVKGNRVMVTLPDTLELPKVIVLELADKIADLHRNQLASPIVLPFGDSALIPLGSLQGEISALYPTTARPKVALITPPWDSLHLLRKHLYRVTQVDKEGNFKFEYLPEDSSWFLIAFFDDNQDNLPGREENYVVAPKKVSSGTPIEELALIPHPSHIDYPTFTFHPPQLLRCQFKSMPDSLPFVSIPAKMDHHSIYLVVDSSADTIRLKMRLIFKGYPWEIDTLIQIERQEEYVPPPLRAIADAESLEKRDSSVSIFFNRPVGYQWWEKIASLITKPGDSLALKADSLLPLGVALSFPQQDSSFQLSFQWSFLDTLWQDQTLHFDIKEESGNASLAGRVDGKMGPKGLMLYHIVEKSLTVFPLPVDSTFAWNSISPGRYRLIAWHDTHRNQCWDPGWLRSDSLIHAEPLKIFPDTLILRPYWEIEDFIWSIP